MFTFTDTRSFVTWYIFKENGFAHRKLYDHWSVENYYIGKDHEYLIIDPYEYCLLEEVLD